MLSLFTGLVNKDKANSLKKKIMSVTTESPVYQWIIEEGIEKGKLESARVMDKEGYPLDDIIKITGLTKKQLKDAGIKETDEQ